MARLLTLLRGLGPYAAIELLLPGGSLIALLIWFYRSRRVATAGALVLGSTMVLRQKQSAGGLHGKAVTPPTCAFLLSETR
jgi:hypothetical protein